METYEREIPNKISMVKDADINITNVPEWNRLTLNEHDTEFTEAFQHTINDESIPEADDYYSKDGYLNMEVRIRRSGDDELERAIVKRCVVGPDGVPVGTANKNPLLDTRKFEVQYKDGTIEIMPANIIAENIMSQVDEQGHKQMMIDKIISHEKLDCVLDHEDRHEKHHHKVRTSNG